MANENRVGILISAKDEASATIKNVKGNLSDLGKETGSVNDLTSAFSGLGKAAGLVGIAIGAIQVGQAVVELAQLGVQAQRIEASFQTLTQQAGIAADGLLTSLQKASSGTIDNTELMLTANRALTLGVADSTQELEQLMEVAIARGKALGLSAQQAFSDLVTGIGRISPLILDNLGIITGGEKVFEDYARSIGKSGDALSDTERKQALVNKVIAESRDLVSANAAAGNDAAASFERVAASFQNLKTDLGELFGPAIAAFASSLATAVDATSQAISNTSVTLDLNEAIGNVQTFSASIQRSEAELSQYRDFLSQITVGSQEYADQQRVISDAELQLVTNKRQLAAAQQSYFDLLRATFPAQDQNAAALNRTSIEAEAMANALTRGSGAMVNQQSAAANLNASINLLSGSYDLLIQRANILEGVSGSLGSIASQVAGVAGGREGVEFFNETTEAAEAQIKAWQEVGFSQAEITNVLLPSYTSQIRKSAEETYVFGQAATKANQLAGQSVKALSAEYENLKSTASGILSGALNDIGGVDLDSILPREDSVGEDARRLADIAVRGFDSPWAAYFQEKFPEIFDQLASSGNPREAAAQILREFQAGLRPELLDKGKAKELVKRAIIGEQNIKALSDEIAAEVAKELGISLAEAQTAAAKALGGTTTDQKEQKISIVPTIDKTQLAGQELNLTAKVTAIDYADSINRNLDYSATVTTLDLADDLSFPILAAQMAIDEIVIADNVKPPTPVIVGGMTIDAVDLRSDVVIPVVELTGVVIITPPNTDELTSKTLEFTAIVVTMTLGDNVALPIVAAEMAISRIVLSEGVTPPTPSIVGGLTIDSILLPSTLDIPKVETQANTTIVLLNKETIESEPLNIATNISLPETLQLSANVTLQPLDATSITEKPLQLSAVVGLITLPDTVETPIIRSVMILDSVTLDTDADLPEPPIVGSMTINGVVLGDDVVFPKIALDATTTVQPIDVTAAEQTAVNLQANVELPELDITSTVTVIPPDTSAITSQVLQLSAIVYSVTIGDDAEIPALESRLLINAIELSDGIVAPVPTLTQQLIIDSITLADNVETPIVDIVTNATISLLNKTEIEETPLRVQAEVILPELEQLSATVLIAPIDSASVTETALSMSAIVDLISINETVEIPILRSSLILDSVTIGDNTELPAPEITGSVVVVTVTLSENVVLPAIDLIAQVTFAPLDLTTIEQTPVKLTAEVILPDTQIVADTQLEPLDLSSINEAKPVLSAAVNVDWLSASIDTAPDDVRDRLALNLPTSVDWESTDTETAKIGLQERLSLQIVPTISFEGIELEEPLLFLQESITPTVVPVVDYLSLTLDELSAAGYYIAAGINEGIVAFNLGAAIVSELNKAQLALRENGIVSGQTWGSGFNAGASEYITSIVQVVVGLALAQIAKTGTRTGAQ